MRREDLNAEQRKAFDMWRRLGLSEQSALRAMEQDGQIQVSEEDGQARMFSEVFGLSASAARRAVEGRDGPSRRPASGPVSEVAVRLSAGPQPGDALQLVGKIEELAAELCRRGLSEEKSLREAAFAVFRVAPDDWTQEWVAKVIEHRWPALLTGSGSSGSRRASGKVHG
jgi:hypothetical protein